MKTAMRIWVAFLLNLILAIVGILGGILTGSMAVISNSLHSLGDSITIGIASVLEKKSKHSPDEKHTFGYARYSAFGGLLTNIFLIVGSLVLVMESIERLTEPAEMETDGIIVLAIAGAIMNFAAMMVTCKRKNSNERAVSLHALQDTLSWLAVILSVVIADNLHFESADTFLSIIIAVVIFGHALKDLLKDLYIFLDNTPPEVDYHQLTNNLKKLKGVESFHHLHVWSLDGENHCASVHVVGKTSAEAVRKIFDKSGIHHATIELESEDCKSKNCQLKTKY